MRRVRPRFALSGRPVAQHRRVDAARTGGLVDADSDCDEARAAGVVLLPYTGMVWGRKSTTDSHHGYVVDEPPGKATEQFNDPLRSGKGAHLIELRSTGGQTVMPPSIYPADPEKGHAVAEPCIWSIGNEPASIDARGLRRAVARVAAAALIGRYWRRDTRHDSALALSGGLLRGGWSVDDAVSFVEAVCTVAGDSECRDRIQAVRDTADTLKTGGNATGWPSLAKHLGKDGETICKTAREWLGIRDLFNQPDLAASSRSDESPSDDTAPVETIAPSTPDYPAPIAPEAFHGLAGRFARVVEPASEADPVALFIQFLLAVGNAVGRHAHAIVEGDKHYLNEYGVLVGISAKGRKGTSWGRVRKALASAEERWAADRVIGGLSSGEGVIWNVRDPIEKQEKVSQGRGQAPRYEKVVADSGIEDKHCSWWNPSSLMS